MVGDLNCKNNNKSTNIELFMHFFLNMLFSLPCRLSRKSHARRQLHAVESLKKQEYHLE